MNNCINNTFRAFHWIMRIFICLSFIVPLCSTLYSQQIQYWNPLPSPTSHTLTRVFFSDSLDGWISGQNGVLMHTSNGGGKWIQKISGTVSEIPDIFVRTKNDIWALEYRYPVDDTSWFGTNILHSTNAGEQWSVQRYDSIIFQTIFFQDSLTGFIAGSNGTIVKTTNAGSSWYKVAEGDSAHQNKWPIVRIKFFNKTLGYAVGGQLEITGLIWKTTNGGETWNSQQIAIDPIYSIHIFDSLHIFCGMGDLDSQGAGFLRSTDAGTSWVFENTTIWGEPTTFEFRTPTEGWVPMGIGGMCLRTTDEGFSWQQISLPQQAVVYDISFPDERNGFMVGHSGTLYKFNTNVLTVKHHYDQAKDFFLANNFPNPFNGETTITYRLPKESRVKIMVFDMLGREIELILNEVKPKGEYSVRWNSKNLPSGVYVFRLRADGFVKNGKMILQR